MAEVINTNVIATDKKFVDVKSLEYFWGKTKTYVDAADAAIAARVTTNEGAISSIQDELNSLSGGAGSIATQIENAIAALKLPETYDAAGSADGALEAAKAYADGLAGNYDAAGAAAAVQSDLDTHKADAVAHVTATERADWNAAKTAIDAFLADADMTESAVDTLKELQSYMTTDGAAATALVNRVATLESINHDAYKAADEAVLTSAKEYANGLADSYETAGAAAQALTDAKAYTDAEIGKLSFDAAGSAAQALTDAKAYVDGKDSAMNTRVAALEAIDHSAYAVKSDVEAAIKAAKEAAIADADAKLAAKADADKVYTKTEVDNLLSTNSLADQAYAKTYTDALYSSIQFAQNSDIDALFA